MPFHEQDGLRYYTFDIFPKTIIQAIFTRQGGVSPYPQNALNVGGMVGDKIENVRTNRIRSFNALGLTPDSVHDVWQVHSADVIFADVPRPIETEYKKADILLTDNPQVTLFMRFADCTPILLYDPKMKVIGMVHSGWLGTIRGAASAAIQSMQERYGCLPADILAAIGPAIGPDHYEVGEKVISQARKAFGPESDNFIEQHGNRMHFNLWKANQGLLNNAGVQQVEISSICTVCHPADWFSHRAENGKTGRFGALLAIQT